MSKAYAHPKPGSWLYRHLMQSPEVFKCRGPEFEFTDIPTTSLTENPPKESNEYARPAALSPAR